MTERGYLGEVLEELRLERGMSLRDLAAQAGLSVGYLSELESGKQKNPSLEALRGIAVALGVSITVSRDEPGYIRVSEGSPPCVSVVRSGVPTVREEIEEAKEEASAFNPDWVSSPGDTIADIMEERGLKPEHLAVLADLSLGYVNRLLKGEAEITREVAIGLELALGPTEDFWLAREANYRKALRARSEWRRGEVKRERVEEAADWRKSDNVTLKPSSITPLDWRHYLAERESMRGFAAEYQGVPPERDQHEDWDAMKAAMDKDPALRAMWRRAPMYEAWKAAKAEAKTCEPGAEGYQRVYVEVAPCQTVEVNTEPFVVGHAIGVDLAHGPGKAVTTVWRVRDGKMEMLPPWRTWAPETWRLAIVGDTGTWVELETTSDVVGYAAPGGNAADWTALLMMLRAGTPGRASMRLAWHAELGIFCFRNHREGLATPFRLSRDEAPDVATWLEEELLKLGIKVATPVLDDAEAT